MLRTLTIPVAVLSSALVFALGSAPGAAQGRSEVVGPAYAEHSLLGPALAEGLERVHRVEARYLELGLLFPNGALNPLPPQPDTPGFKLLAGEEPSHFPGLGAFRFGPPESDVQVTIEQVIECGLADAGARTARSLMARVAGFGPEDLLRAFDESLLFGEPLRPTDQARALHRAGLEQRRLAPLSNASLAYVCFGFLHLAPFWEPHPGARETFVSELITRGTASVPMALAVRRVLQPPLAPHPERRAAGFAYGLHSERGRVGFTARHERELTALVADLEAIGAAVRRQALARAGIGPPAAPGEQPAAETPAPATELAPAPITPGDLAFFSGWAAELLLWARRELHPEGLYESMRRADTLAERARYWSSLAESVAFASFRQAVLEELALTAADTDALPGADRIATLEALAAGGELGEAESAELEALRTQRTNQRVELVGHLARLLVESGGESDFATVASTLAWDLPTVLGASEPGQRLESLLRPAWLRLAHVPHPDSLWVLHRHLHEPEGRLPLTATMELMRMATVHRLPGHEALLEDTLVHGGAIERGSILLRSDWLSGERYGAELTRLADVARDTGAPLIQRSFAQEMTLASIANRRDAGAREVLRASLRDGLWRPDQGMFSWSQGDADLRRSVLGLLTPEERRAFTEQGLLPPHLR